MFKIKSLHLENFMSIDSADLEFEDNQMTAITGANGAGKSSLIYAIDYCLTGYRKGDTIKNYVKTGTDMAKIYLTGYLRDEPISYDMEIYTKRVQPSSKRIDYKGKVYLNSECTQFIEEFELEDIEKLMFMLQGSNDIIGAKPAERAATLKKLFKFEFDDIVNKLKNEQDQNKIKTVEETAVLKELSSRSYDKLTLMREVAPIAITSWENRISDINSNLNKIGDIDESELDKCEEDIQTTQHSISVLETKLTQDKSSISKLNSQIKDLKLDVDIDSLKQDRDKISQDITQHELDYSFIRDKYTKLNEELSVLEYRKKEVNAQYNISKTGICHACGQPIEQKHIENLKSELDNSIKSISDKKLEITKLAFDKQDGQGKELAKKLSNIDDQIKRYNSDLKQRDTINIRLGDINNLISERELALDGLKSKLNLLIDKRSNLSSMSDLIKEKNNLINEKQQIEQKLQDARDNRIKNAERRSTNDKLAREQKERDVKVKEINQELNDLVLKTSRIKEEIDIFETKFPNYIVLQACEHLEGVINSIVQRVFPYCKVSLKLTKTGVSFFYLSESSGDEWIPVNMASGCQAKIISIAYFVALARLSGITCIFLDEIDASMSAENASKIYEFIASLSGFDQIFFISHRPEAHEAVKSINDKLITYVVENGNYTEI